MPFRLSAPFKSLVSILSVFKSFVFWWLEILAEHETESEAEPDESITHWDAILLADSSLFAGSDLLSNYVY